MNRHKFVSGKKNPAKETKVVSKSKSTGTPRFTAMDFVEPTVFDARLGTDPYYSTSFEECKLYAAYHNENELPEDEVDIQETRQLQRERQEGIRNDDDDEEDLD